MERAALENLVRDSGCAELCGGFVFLGDPRWGAEERAQFAQLKESIREAGSPELREFGWLAVPSGGTSGRLKFARHDERTLAAAARGFREHFGFARVNAIDVLPPFHVSGLLARVRCAVTGGEHLAWSWKQIEAGAFPALPTRADGWVISLVPTQLQRLLASAAAVAWLREFRAVFIGGGPAWAELNEAAASSGVRVSLSYGLTETAAMVAALRPEEFASGERSCGAALPHALVTIVDEASGELSLASETGLVRVSGASVFRGYVGAVEAHATETIADTRCVVTEDLGRLDGGGRLTILGRRDAVIITGGKKVFPAEVEAALWASGQFREVAVIGVPDRDWGERVIACYPTDFAAPDFARVELRLAELAAFKRPKQFRAVAPWPLTPQGKVNRAVLAKLAAE